ncbi:P-loop containing nucleoside triphosphate hydrolase [Pseudocohnilembus persalinus]|uniref:DNA 3'-5' helicase n=1 Tax=Pseudocohnilembus persalinus TaxID=266149 RepID=A0A0V0Q8P5_PSEPJ|nr:P-loop containing nucleoside triphosphate hydrolase [Pseudocohnilembus persalinus]|eukprot:KRW98627.1 P-loop containing nucleoside triphosphate hydrolase [Pseudocohnilembus persalinus]
MDYSNSIALKEDYKTRPIIIDPDKGIHLEVDNQLYRIAYEFLISIADPIFRPTHIHYFKLTKYSLYTAMVLQYHPTDIIKLLDRLAKNKEIPVEVKDFINQNTQNYGSCRMFLANQFYYLDIQESLYQKYIQKEEKLLQILEEVNLEEHEQILIQNRELQSLQQNVEHMVKQNKKQTEAQEKLKQKEEKKQQEYDSYSISSSDSEDYLDSKEYLENDDKNNNSNQLDFQNQNPKNQSNQKMDIENSYDEYSKNPKNKKKFKRFKINGDHFIVSQFIIENNIPLIQEYDYLKNHEIDKQNNQIIENLNIKPMKKIRFYQERALKNIFIAHKARSGLIILPCGAGKTIVGIMALTNIKRNSIIICDSDVSVDQWRDELERWTTISRNDIVRLTGKIQDKWDNLDKPIILITTYYMLVKKREKNNNPIIEKMKQIQEWNVCIIDEVHKLPAQTFQNVLRQFKFHFKLGLTATPYREDDKINNLFYMIGPKLYEENWQDLVQQGFLAKPYCIELRCNMTPIFSSEYKDKKGHQRELIHTSNPTKFKALQYLIKLHEQRGDKILVFCDRPKVIEEYGKMLFYPVIHGKTSQEERKKIFTFFKTNNQINTIFLSRVGDTAIDLPAANVGIQIGVHFGSRRQEVQRLGRIMRAKENTEGEYNAFWYTLISQNTDETIYCWGRQKCLIDQGFKYEIVNEEELPYHKKQKNFSWLKEIDEKQYLLDLLLEQDAVETEKQQKKNKKNQQYSSSSSSDSDEDSQEENSNSQNLFTVRENYAFENEIAGGVQPYLEIGQKNNYKNKN